MSEERIQKIREAYESRRSGVGNGHIQQPWIRSLLKSYDKAIRQRDHARAQVSEAWEVWADEYNVVRSTVPPLLPEDDDGWTP